jgi:glutathione S-transferase
MTQFGLLEATAEISAYLQRFAARPAVQRARALDQALLAGQ